METKKETRYVKDVKVAIRCYLKLEGEATSKELAKFCNDINVGYNVTQHDIKGVINNRKQKQSSVDPFKGLKKYKNPKKLDTYTFKPIKEGVLV